MRVEEAVISRMAGVVGLPADASDAEVREALAGGDPMGDRIAASLPALGSISDDAYLRVAARATPPMSLGLSPVTRLDELLKAISIAQANGSPAPMVAYIVTRAKALGLASRLPPNWKVVAENTALASGQPFGFADDDDPSIDDFRRGFGRAVPGT